MKIKNIRYEDFKRKNNLDNLKREILGKEIINKKNIPLFSDLLLDKIHNLLKKDKPNERLHNFNSSLFFHNNKTHKSHIINELKMMKF